jgi:hypothetical protein
MEGGREGEREREGRERGGGKGEKAFIAWRKAARIGEATACTAHAAPTALRAERHLRREPPAHELRYRAS